MALPLLTAQTVGTVGVFAPIAFDRVGPGAVSVPFLGARANSITSVFGLARLSVVDSLGATSRVVGEYLGEAFLYGGHYEFITVVPRAAPSGR